MGEGAFATVKTLFDPFIEPLTASDIDIWVLPPPPPVDAIVTEPLEPVVIVTFDPALR